MARIWVVRHAKSSWDDVDLRDFDRPLNARGMKDGEQLRRWMQNQPDGPAWIVASDARRARDTAAYVREGFQISDDHVLYEHRLYEASPETMLDVIRELPDVCPSVALVGHNPGSSTFVNAMTGLAKALQLPTFGIAILEVELPWNELRFGCAKLIALHTPKSLRE